MLINRLNIEGFRGVSSSLELKLSAPLTVIYAPNGTGKTSICDAAEWLLSGKIGRLEDHDDVKCQFGGSETFVEATFLSRNMPYTFKRTLVNNESTLQGKIGGEEYREVLDKELLGLFVDALLPRGNSSSAKIAWVRSTRFLESDSLGLLIDSDKESNNTQKLIFSNLFGVNEHQKNEIALNRMLEKLPAASTIAKEKEKIAKKKSEYEEVIKKLVNSESKPYRDYALSLLNAIATPLGFDVSGGNELDLSAYYNRLKVGFIQYIEKLTFEKDSLAFIRKNLLAHQEHQSKADKLERILLLENKALEELEANFAEKKEKLAKRAKDVGLQKEIVSELERALDKLKIAKSKFNHLYGIYETPFFESEDRLNKLSEDISGYEKRISDVNDNIFLIEESIVLFPDWVNIQDVLKKIAIQLGELQISQDQKAVLDALPERISEVEAKLHELRIVREQALEELALLLSSGKRYVETHEDVSECPLCEHRYTTHSELMGKITRKFEKLSSDSKEEAVLQSECAYLKTLWGQEEVRSKRCQELDERTNSLLKRAQDIEAKLIGVGLAKVDFTEKDRVLSQLKEMLAQRKAAFDAGKNLEELLGDVKYMAMLWKQKLGDLQYDEPQSIDYLGRDIVSLELVLEKQSALSKRLLLEYSQASEEGAVHLLALEKTMNEQASSILSYKAELTDAKNIIADFHKKWSVISEAEVINGQELEKASLNIDGKDRVCHEVKGFFEKIEEYFNKIREVEKNELERLMYQREIEGANNQLQEWINQEEARLVLENEIEAIQKEIKRFIANEISPLSNTINALYLRAQGNRFINSISIKSTPSKKGFLDWIATLDENGEELDKMRFLSQGQRQDLGLAIFLARARNLGGTFFLDEPLAHLDDLNRVALLDTLRVIVSENRSVPLRLVITTSSNNLLRHLREKFSLVKSQDGEAALHIYKMRGNPKVGLEVEEESVSCANYLLAMS